jgi:hypothetical protein
MEASQSYFAVLPVLSLPDGAIRADEDTAVAYLDVEEAISTARWLVGGGGWIGAVVFRRQFRPALGLFEDAEIVMKVGRFSSRVTPDCKFVIC